MTEPLATIIGAKILDQLLDKAVGKAMDSALGSASKALKDARAELDKETTQRAARMALIVQKAAEELQPALEQIKLETGQDHSLLFQHSTFWTMVAKDLLEGTRLDLPSVQVQYVEMFSDDKWPGLTRPLVMFFDHLNRLLTDDQEWPWAKELQAYRVEAQVTGAVINLEQLVALAEQIAGTLDAQPEHIAEAIHRPERMRLEAWEASYLRGLYARCNKLPLEEKRARGTRPPDAIGPAPRSFRLQRSSRPLGG